VFLECNVLLNIKYNLYLVKLMEESICRIELETEDALFIAKVQTDMGGAREYRSKRFDRLLSQLMTELQAEFEPDFE
jgi:hypothetical protein